MHYRLGFSSKLENPSVYIECSVRKPGIRHPVREIVKRLAKEGLIGSGPSRIGEDPAGSR